MKTNFEQNDENVIYCALRALIEYMRVREGEYIRCTVHIPVRHKQALAIVAVAHDHSNVVVEFRSLISRFAPKV